MKPLLEMTPPGGRPYPVLLGGDVAAGLERIWDDRWQRVAVIGDANTLKWFGNPLAAALESRGCRVTALDFPPGEASKTRATKERLEDAMLTAGIDRHGCVVAVGGGVALDLAGFVAATYMRGIAHVNVATTLLAQVDAALGGKTAVNTRYGKNLVGAFHHPRAVLIDTSALATLSDDDLRGGLAEAIKHAALWDERLFCQLEAWASARRERIPPDAIVGRCVAIKAEIVARDDRDEGIRNALNYGHTVAHAIERATDHAISHGHAVAIGMVIEARLAVRAGWLDHGSLERLERLLAAVGLPIVPPCPFERAAPYFARDKKSRGDEVHCAIPCRLGRIEPVAGGGWTRVVGVEPLRAAWMP